MYLAWVYKTRAAATPPAPVPRGAKPPPRQGVPMPFLPAQGTFVQPPPPQQQGDTAFHHLSPVEQQERCRQGLCYNCDEPYVRGHIFKCLFYLELADFVNDDSPADGGLSEDGD
ncbi:hypothetical protein U9M48_030589 [Paspalum notatum var. saurae]|uniref:Uncharacterized protein n=1 Tax=Paspalum notatum var. saurae TaxID=547442 RepID=A0AAQ3X2B4_PASNO